MERLEEKRMERSELVGVRRNLIFFSLLVLLLSVMKYAVGVYTGVTVLQVDALHSFSDFIGYLSLIFTLFLMTKESKRFPYGLYKMESLITFFIALFIIYNAIEMGIGASPQSVSSMLAVLASLISCFVSFFISSHQQKMGKEANLKSVEIFAREQYFDSIFSALVALSIFLSTIFPTLPYLLSLVIVVLIFKAGVEGIVDSVRSLLDMEPPGVREEIEKRLKKMGIKPAKVRVRKAGPCYFAEIIIPISADMDMIEFEGVKNRVIEELGELTCYVSVVPEIGSEREVVAVPVSGSEIADRFSNAEKFLFFIIESGKIKESFEKKNRFLGKELRRGAAVANWLSEQGVTVVITQNIGFIAYSTLKGKGIRVYRAEKGVEESVRAFLEGRLKKLEKPTRVRI